MQRNTGRQTGLCASVEVGRPFEIDPAELVTVSRHVRQDPFALSVVREASGARDTRLGGTVVPFAPINRPQRSRIDQLRQFAHLHGGFSRGFPINVGRDSIGIGGLLAIAQCGP